MAVLPAAHPLAARASLRTGDLRDENVHLRRGPSTGPEPASLTELLQLVALGQKLALVRAMLPTLGATTSIVFPLTTPAT
ncbi:hypothetical protein FAIPA1_50192 [Frankia sp. AiPs1]|uniref:hypothetical protein n=1 Tax=Frankia sp. AiPa1 TaxID=573492 RepID=UPI00202B81E6|nr:hypothetical protein [Frankia sp. AiPa1]MCL9762280.1 hypothetical protein [Frankia sp. AiPa1]